MHTKIVVKLTKVTKKYLIHHDKPTLVERILNGKNEEFIALNKINLSIKKGEIFGIIGGNGSGKTTLLKIISGIASPTTGSVHTSGLIVSLIDLEAGFHPDLTGIQNVFLNGIVLGMNNLLIKKKLKKIIEFANIGRFIDAPLFTYSEGMKLRLGFSIAIQSDPDILILDENLSVGDEIFRKLSFDKLNSFAKEGKTIIMASHDLKFIKKYCQKVIELKNGRIFQHGRPPTVISKYLIGK